VKNHRGLFQKGTSGNPGGRPKSKPVTDALRVILDTRDPVNVLDDCPDETNATRLARQMFHKAMNGDAATIEKLVDRTEGKPVQPISGDEEGPPLTTITYHYIRPEPRDEDD